MAPGWQLGAFFYAPSGQIPPSDQRCAHERNSLRFDHRAAEPLEY